MTHEPGTHEPETYESINPGTQGPGFWIQEPGTEESGARGNIEERGLGLADFLEAEFSSPKALLTFDVGLKFVGGARSIRILAQAKNWQAVEMYTSTLSGMDPHLWTIKLQHDILDKTMTVLGVQAPYLRFHQFRDVSVLAECFGASRLPVVDEQDWFLLLENMRGTGRNAETCGLQQLPAALDGAAYVDELVRKEFGEEWRNYNLYDLSCALCLVGGKAEYHKDQFKPYAVRNCVSSLRTMARHASLQLSQIAAAKGSTHGVFAKASSQAVSAVQAAVTKTSFRQRSCNRLRAKANT